MSAIVVIFCLAVTCLAVLVAAITVREGLENIARAIRDMEGKCSS